MDHEWTNKENYEHQESYFEELFAPVIELIVDYRSNSVKLFNLASKLGDYFVNDVVHVVFCKVMNLDNLRILQASSYFIGKQHIPEINNEVLVGIFLLSFFFVIFLEQTVYNHLLIVRIAISFLFHRSQVLILVPKIRKHRMFDLHGECSLPVSSVVVHEKGCEIFKRHFNLGDVWQNLHHSGMDP